MMTDFALGSQALSVASRLAAAEEMDLARLFGLVLAKRCASAEPLVVRCVHHPRFRREVLLISGYVTATRGGGLRCLLLLPAATERLVDLDERQSFIELRLDEIQLRRVIAGFARQHLEITRAALFVEHLGELVGPPCCLSEQFLLAAEVTIFLISDQRIRNLLERVLNRLLIREHRFLPLRSGEF